MSASQCEVTVRHLDDVVALDLIGDIDRNAEGAVMAAYDELPESAPHRLLLNFSNVGYINSTGIAVIVGLLARTSKEGRSVTAYGLSDHYKEIFEVTRLSDFITIANDEHEAVEGRTATA